MTSARVEQLLPGLMNTNENPLTVHPSRLTGLGGMNTSPEQRVGTDIEGTEPPISGISTPQSVLGRARNGLLVGLGCLCLVIAAIGVVVPLLPTVDFLLLAAFFFDRGSPRMHAWLLSLPTVGPIIRDWEEHRVIRKRGKVMSVGAIAVVFGYVVFFAKIRLISRYLMAALGVSIVAFILTRPSNRPDERKAKRVPSEPPQG